MWSKDIIKIMITDKCNLNCKYCSTMIKERNDLEKAGAITKINSNKDSNQLIFEKLRTAKKENKVVLITGGEPTISPSFLSILKYLATNKIKAIIETNGLFFSKEEYLIKLLPFLSKDIIFDLMINGYNSDIHDYLTQYPGSFILLKKAIFNLKKYNLQFYMHTVINKVNYRYSRLLAKLIIRLKPKYFRFIFIKPEGNAYDYFDELVPYISLVRPELVKAFKILLNSFLDFHIENLPYCALPYFEKYVYNQNDSDKVKFAFCKKCSFEFICNGFYDWYIQKKCDDDLKPVLAAKIKSPLFLKKDSPAFPDNPFDFISDFSQRR